MFENIGNKIKILAIVLAILGIILSIVIGTVIIVQEKFLPGFLFIIIGSLSSWISSFFVFGFGEVIECLQEISYNTRRKEQSKLLNSPQASNYTVANYKPLPKSNTKTIRCPDCRQEIPNNTQKCPYCDCEVQKYK